MTVRRFQLGANVFEVDVRGNELLVGIGKLGRPTLKPRVKASEVEARAEMDKLIANHLAKGYVEVELPPDPEIKRAKQRAENAAFDRKMAAIDAQRRVAGEAWATKLAQAAFVPARNAELEAKCSDDDPMSWQVYADWLIDKGDPRGTIAQTFFRTGPEAAEVACKELTPHGTIRLHNGFARSASIGGEQLADKVRLLCGAGVACTVKRLRVGLADRGNWTSVVAAIAASPLASSLVELELNAADRLDRDPEEYSDDADDFFRTVAPVHLDSTPEWSQLTTLERLTIDGPYNGTLGLAPDAKLGSLRELTIRSNYLYTITDLMKLQAAAPALQRLAIFSSSIRPDHVAELRDAFGKRLVTTGDTEPPARYGSAVE